jgi:hypothetical protein
MLEQGRPILFSGPMVRAILEGRKTQTRRVMKPQPLELSDLLTQVVSEPKHWWREAQRGALRSAVIIGKLHRCPYGGPGDRLWVRETHILTHDPGWGVVTGAIYRADLEEAEADAAGPWRPSIHMPRKVSRITLVVANVQVERVQSITEAGARAEGVTLAEFPALWDSINAKRGFGWAANPWVWAVEFERVKP